MLLRLLRTYLRPCIGWLSAVVVLQLISTIASLYLPSLNADIIDKGIVEGDTAYILHTGAWMLGISLVQILCAVAAAYYGAKTAMTAGRELRRDVFTTVCGFSGRELGRFGAPSLITRNTNDVQQVQRFIAITCTILVTAPIMGIGGIAMALHEDVGLSWLVGVSVPVLAIAVGVILRRMIPLFRQMQARLDDINRVLREQLTGIRVVRAFVREPIEIQRFDVANQNLTDVSLGVGRLMVMMFPTIIFVLNGSSVAVLWFGAQRIAAGQMQIGSVTAFIIYLMMILMSVMMASFMLMMVPRASVCAERIAEVLDTESTVVLPKDPVTSLPQRADVEFREVAFKYPGAAEPVLRNISFRVNRGETTAVIGSTGAGKTTLVSLVPRIADVTQGVVLVNGVDVRSLDADVLCGHIGFVPQKPYLFSGTVASNLRYGRPEATEEELWEALDIAQARDFVTAMEGGLDAPISQGGTNVSGGQRQRLSIARALIRRPDIYLFDESFSALDVGTSARLQSALRPITRHAAVLLVAQRVATIRHADQIVVLDNGSIVGIGRHNELLENCPTYAEIVESQVSVDEEAG